MSNSSEIEINRPGWMSFQPVEVFTFSAYSKLVNLYAISPHFSFVFSNISFVKLELEGNLGYISSFLFRTCVIFFFLKKLTFLRSFFRLFLLHSHRQFFWLPTLSSFWFESFWYILNPAGKKRCHQKKKPTLVWFPFSLIMNKKHFLLNLYFLLTSYKLYWASTN